MTVLLVTPQRDGIVIAMISNSAGTPAMIGSVFFRDRMIGRGLVIETLRNVSHSLLHNMTAA